MFITNALNPAELLAELLKGPRVVPSATNTFAELRHDKDLCPQFHRQVQSMLDAYKAYGQEAHDIQSFRDDGVDIILNYEDKKKGIERRARIQIKSEDEFRKWEAGTLPLMQILKGQFATALENARLDEYFIVLCVDANRHQNRIRTLCSELKNFRKCQIIEPAQVLDFYSLSSLDIWIRTVRILCSGDQILEAVTKAFDALEPDEAYFLITLVCQTFGSSYEVTQDRLSDIWDNWEEFAGDSAGDFDRISGIVGTLEANGYLQHTGGGDFILQAFEFPEAICGLYYDLKIRSADLAATPFLEMVFLANLKERARGVDDTD